MRAEKKWWEKRIYWAISAIIIFLASLIFDSFIFHIPIATSFIISAAAFMGVVLAYYSLKTARGEPVHPRLRRLTWDMGGLFFGTLAWMFGVLPALNFYNVNDIYAGLLGFSSLFILVGACVLAWDYIGRRRHYRPFTQ